MKMAEQSYTVDEWCRLRKLSKSMFYKMLAQGLAPRTHNAGRKRLISPEADAAWMRQGEAEAAEPQPRISESA
jgi:hypothetical protein